MKWQLFSESVLGVASSPSGNSLSYLIEMLTKNLNVIYIYDFIATKS